MIGPIRSREVFRRFDRRAARRRSGPITVLHVPDASEDVVGVAFAIPRKVGPAVRRNRLRRQLRAAFVDLDAAADVPSGWYLVIVHPGAVGTPYQGLLGAVRDCLDGLPAAEKRLRGAEK